MAAKKKPLTKREKALRDRARKELKAEGLIPPDKPRLNRKKFARETWTEFTEFLGSDFIRAEHSLLKSIGFMVGPDLHEVTPEQVGVLKLLKMAVEYDKFMQTLKSEGRDNYTLGELADEVVIPIIKL